MFQKFKHGLYIWKHKMFGKYISIKEFDFERAQKYMLDNWHKLDAMTMCLLWDSNIMIDIMKYGEIYFRPKDCVAIYGVQRTSWDIPCIRYRMKNGKEGWIKCYKEYGYNKESNTILTREPVFAEFSPNAESKPTVEDMLNTFPAF